MSEFTWLVLLNCNYRSSTILQLSHSTCRSRYDALLALAVVDVAVAVVQVIIVGERSPLFGGFGSSMSVSVGERSPLFGGFEIVDWGAQSSLWRVRNRRCLSQGTKSWFPV